MSAKIRKRRSTLLNSRRLGVSLLTVVARVDCHECPCEKTQDEPAGSPLKPNPNGVREQDDDNGDPDDAEHRGL
jgi:hypothetical protein